MLLMLSQVEIFKTIPREELADLGRSCQTRAFRAGDVLMRQGDLSGSMYVIVMGRVRVERTVPHILQPLVLAELGPSEAVGEMGVLDGQPRSATVTAIEDTVTIELTAGAVTQLLSRFPEISSTLLRTLTRRLRETDELIGRSLPRPEA